MMGNRCDGLMTIRGRLGAGVGASVVLVSASIGVWTFSSFKFATKMHIPRTSMILAKRAAWRSFLSEVCRDVLCSAGAAFELARSTSSTTTSGMIDRFCAAGGKDDLL